MHHRSLGNARLPLAVLACLLSFLLCYIGLGWAVWQRQPWLGKVVGGARFYRLQAAYEHVAEHLLPNDQDGDGVSDGFELFWRTDPQNPKDHAWLKIEWKNDDFCALNASQKTGLQLRMIADHFLAPVRGQLMHVEARVVLGDLPHLFPANFRLRLTAPSFARIALPGAALTASPLVVPVARDGSFAFDLLVPTDAGRPWRESGYLFFVNAATAERLSEVEIGLLSRREPIQPTVEMTDSPPKHRGGSYDRKWKLFWPSPMTRHEFYLIEAARDQDDATWYSVDCVQTEHDNIKQTIGMPLRPYSGPLKFRVVPVSPEP